MEWPKYGMGHYLVINNVGRMFLATEFLSHFPQGMVFYIPKRDRPYIGVDRVKAWAEVPPLKVDE